MSISKASLAAAVAASFIAGIAQASSTGMEALSNSELLKRWNKQAGWYDKAYLLEACADKNVPNTAHSFLLCDTAGGKGLVTFRRKGGQLESVEYAIKGQPVLAASMFVRFVRNSRTGNMGAVGSELLSTAMKNGKACADEAATQVCAMSSAGEYSMFTVARQSP